MHDVTGRHQRMRYAFETRCPSGRCDGGRRASGGGGPDGRREPRDGLSLVEALCDQGR